MPRIAHGVAMIGLASLGACASNTPKSTLMPDDVPVLYEAPDTSKISFSLCEELNLEYARLNDGIGEKPVEKPAEKRRTMEERLNKRVRSLLRSELNKQLGGALDVVNFLTDRTETERLRAIGKKRGMIRRAYVMGFMDASACSREDKPEIELHVVSTDEAPAEILDEGVEIMVLADTHADEMMADDGLVQASEFVEIAELGLEIPEEILAAAAPEKVASFAVALDYVVADEALVSEAGVTSKPLLNASDVDEDGMWPRKEALVYINEQVLQSAGNVLDVASHVDSSVAKDDRPVLPGPDDVDEDGMWPPPGTLSFDGLGSP